MPGEVIEMFRMAFWPTLFFEKEKTQTETAASHMAQEDWLLSALNDTQILTAR